MACDKLCSGPYSALHTKFTPCSQKSLTKIALIVIGLLFAGGAVAAHFSGLGIPGIVAFSLASGGSFSLFALTCVCCNHKQRQRVNNDPSSRPLSPIKHKPEPEEKKDQQIDLNKSEDLMRTLSRKDLPRKLI